MYLLIESIWIIDGRVPLLLEHQQRLDESYKAMFLKNCPFLLINLLDIPSQNGEYKCRFLYNENDYFVEYISYHRSNIKKVSVVTIDESTNYHLKTIERSKLTEAFDKRNGCDEIVMIKENKITDGYYYNLVFEKEGKYFTSKTPLLNGVMRRKLLAENKITAINISLDDIAHYEKIHYINAMNPLGYQTVDLKDVVY